MRRNPGIFSLASPAGFALAAGSTLVCWRRSLARDASQIRALILACDWIDRLATLPATLRDEPLFGSCIAELLGTPIADYSDSNIGHQVKPSRSVVPPRTTQKTSSPFSSTRSQSGNGSGVERSYADSRRVDRSVRQTDSPEYLPHTHFNHSPVDAAELPRRASRALLESCAHSQQPAFQQRGAQYETLRKSPRSLSADLTEMKRDKKTQLHLQQSTAPTKTSFRMSAEADSDTFTKRLMRRTLDVIRSIQPSINGETQVNDWIDQQWSTPLDGTTVSNKKLREIASGETNLTRMRRNRSHRQSSFNTPRSETRISGDSLETSSSHPSGNSDWEMMRRRERSLSSQSPGSESVAGVSVRPRIDSPTKRRTSKPNLPEFLPESALYDFHYGAPLDNSSRDGHEDYERVTNLNNCEPVAPPALAPSLPDLSALPESQNTFTGVLPLASETAKQGARHEAAVSEDLDALAAKIKFILDEQARRHGIDV